MTSPILRSAVAAGFILLASLALAALHRVGYLPGGSEEASQRIIQVILGVIVAWEANAVPKHLPPLGACAPAAEQSARRFVGIALVVGGLAYVATWLLAPFALAPTVSIAALGVALATAVGRCVGARLAAG